MIHEVAEGAQDGVPPVMDLFTACCLIAARALIRADWDSFK